MWRVGLRLFSVLPLPQAVGAFAQLRRGRNSAETLNTALNSTIQQFLSPNAQLHTFDNQQACISLLKEMKEMRRSHQVTALLQAFTSGKPDVTHWAEAYNTARQMLVPVGDFFLLAEQNLLESLVKSEANELVYEALQTYSGLGCAKVPLSKQQKQLAEAIDANVIASKLAVIVTCSAIRHRKVVRASDATAVARIRSVALLSRLSAHGSP